MRITIGPTWAQLFLRSGLGQSGDDPVETQRIYAAVVHRTHEESKWVVDGLTVIQADLDDLDVTGRLLHSTPPSWASDHERLVLKRNARRITRKGESMKRKLIAFKGTMGHQSSGTKAYRAFKGQRTGHEDMWPYYPLRSLCPGDVLDEGVLWPWRFTSPRRIKNFIVYDFVSFSLEEPIPPERAWTLSTRPLRTEIEIVR